MLHPHLTAPPHTPPPNQCANSGKCLSGDTVLLKLDGFQIRRDLHSKCWIVWVDWGNAWIRMGGYRHGGPALKSTESFGGDSLSGLHTAFSLLNSHPLGPPSGPGSEHVQ